MDFRLSLLLVVCTLISCSFSAHLAWRQIQHPGGNLPPFVRWYAGNVVSDDGSVMFMFGGQGVGRDNSSDGVLGDMWMYNIAGESGTWTEIYPATSPDPMFGFIGGVVDNLWIVSHGCDLDTCFTDTWAFDLDTQDWTQLIDGTNHSGPIPIARRHTAGGVYPGENELWLSMGESLEGRKLSDTWILRINTTTFTAVWEEVSPGGGLNQYNPFLPLARSRHAGVPVTPNSFVMYGGCASGGQVGGPCPLHDTWVINLQDRIWEPIANCPRPRTGHSMVTLPSISGSAVIIGGSQTYSPGIFPQQIFPENYNETEIYLLYSVPQANYSSDEWQRVLVQDGVAPARLEGVSVAMSASGDIYLFGGKSLDNDLFQDDVWVLSGDPADDLDQGCLSPIFTFVHLHGVLMYAAWGLFLPIGALLGRYYRWTWPCWFILHVICQSMGVLLTVAGFVIIFLVGNFKEPNFPHAMVGIILTVILIQQYLSGIFHPCVEKENGKTPSDEKGIYRRCWEVYHGASGFISVAIGFGQLTLGVFLVGAPLIVWAVWCGLGGLWIVTFLLHELAYVCTLIVNKVRD